MNIKTIPSSPDKLGNNVLQIAVKSRIKLIYRPAALKDKAPEDMASQVRFDISGKQIVVSNPTPFYMNFGEIQVGGKKLQNVTYAPPGGTGRFELPPGAAWKVTFKLINDFGGLTADLSGSS